MSVMQSVFKLSGHGSKAQRLKHAYPIKEALVRPTILKLRTLLKKVEKKFTKRERKYL